MSKVYKEEHQKIISGLEELYGYAIDEWNKETDTRKMLDGLFNDIGNYIKRLVENNESLDQIMSADSGKAMEALEKVDKSHKLCATLRHHYCDYIKNRLLKTQATEQELAELKKKVREYFKIKNMEEFEEQDFKHLENLQTETEIQSAIEMIMESVESFTEYETKLEKELIELCKGSE